jgi:hypothetical protein
MTTPKLSPADIAKLTAYLSSLVNLNAVPTITRDGKKISIKSATGTVSIMLSGATIRKEKANL